MENEEKQRILEALLKAKQENGIPSDIPEDIQNMMIRNQKYNDNTSNLFKALQDKQSLDLHNQWDLQDYAAGPKMEGKYQENYIKYPREMMEYLQPEKFARIKELIKNNQFKTSK